MAGPQQSQDVDLIFHVVHRTLTDPVYFVNFWGLRLTDMETGLVIAVGILGMSLVEWMGLKESKFFYVPLDPFSYVAAALLFAAFISLAHHFWPKSSVEQVLRSVIAPKRYVPRKRGGDAGWYPSQTPHISWGGRK